MCFSLHLLQNWKDQLIYFQMTVWAKLIQQIKILQNQIALFVAVLLFAQMMAVENQMQELKF